VHPARCMVCELYPPLHFTRLCLEKEAIKLGNRGRGGSPLQCGTGRSASRRRKEKRGKRRRRWVKKPAAGWRPAPVRRPASSDDQKSYAKGEKKRKRRKRASYAPSSEGKKINRFRGVLISLLRRRRTRREKRKGRRGRKGWRGCARADANIDYLLFFPQTFDELC